MYTEIARVALSVVPDRSKEKATIARQREWIEKAGHWPGCKALACQLVDAKDGHCGAFKHQHYEPDDHEFQPGPCDCGWAELAEG